MSEPTGPTFPVTVRLTVSVSDRGTLRQEEYRRAVVLPAPPVKGLWLDGLLGADGPPLLVAGVFYSLYDEQYTARVYCPRLDESTPKQVRDALSPHGWLETV